MDALFVPITFSDPPHPLLTRNTNAGAQSRVGPVYHLSPRSSVIRFNRFPIRCKKLSYPRFSHFRCAAEASDHRHGHHHGHHHHHHGCQHHCGGDGDGAELTGTQKAFLRFAEAIRWSDLANYLREHLHLCCGSAALFVTAAACPYLVPKPAVKPLQNVFIAVAFPLVGVSASLDALIDISGGKVNIHVLMALAAFASIFMGNPLEGGVLLVMFNMAHIAEEYFTKQSMIDVKELKESHPDFALVLDVNDDNLPDTSDLEHRRVPVRDVEVGSYILVGAGESINPGKISEMAQKRVEEKIEFVEQELADVKASVQKIPAMEETLSSLAKAVERISLLADKQQGTTEDTRKMIMSLIAEGQKRKPIMTEGVDDVSRGDGSIGRVEATSATRQEIRKAESEEMSSDRNKFKKVEMPVFNGNDPDSWLFRADRYFSIHKLTDSEKLIVAVISFEGAALDWFRSIEGGERSF